MGSKTVEYLEIGGKEWEIDKDFTSPPEANNTSKTHHERSKSRGSHFDSPVKGGESPHKDPKD